MSEKTARKYLKEKKTPDELKKPNYWPTRKNPFEEVWPIVKEKLELNPELEAKALFSWLQREYPNKFRDGQLRTFQRHVKKFRVLEGPAKEIFFKQKHYPGKLSESDFTHMKELGITINGELFDHLLYHFVLTYSNWETGTICFSESFEALKEGLENALWELGGVPLEHKTDQLTAAVQKLDHPEEFTERYKELLEHYNLTGRKIQVCCPNENGDVEQRHYRFKKAVKQALLLRGSNNFSSIEEYKKFVKDLFRQLNSGRIEKLKEEKKKLRKLPNRKLDGFTKIKARVSKGSTIRILKNIYSVPSRLRGQIVYVYVYAEFLEIWYAQKKIETLPRKRGQCNEHIEYRHIIDSLIKKPGAFENYQYKENLFPSIRFRTAYDVLKMQNQNSADKIYLKILYLAAKESESAVDTALDFLLKQKIPITVDNVKKLVNKSQEISCPKDVTIDRLDLNIYDIFLRNVKEEKKK